jgi:hypothetical protein
MLDNNTIVKFYVSRAYNPGQVFVYAVNDVSGDIYLEVLCTDVSIVREPYDFGNVEI